MSKNPKLEFLKIELKPTNHKNVITFQDFFKEVYKVENPENANVKKGIYKTSDIISGFYKFLYKKIDETYNDNQKIKKAFSAKTIKKDNKKTTSINLDKDLNIIDGIISGGYYDTGKEVGSITDATIETEKLKRDKILLDDFYFYFTHR
ncbi:hypothetical protein [Pedobacter sp. P26]|uniref:hypothetical protein n=1 Tax=Pedobacter sp. P26 TaxID=3423956 RepID=UPI003D67E416